MKKPNNIRMRSILKQLVQFEVTTDEVLLQQRRVIDMLELEDASGSGNESLQLLKMLLHLISIISPRPITTHNVGASIADMMYIWSCYIS